MKTILEILQRFLCVNQQFILKQVYIFTKGLLMQTEDCLPDSCIPRHDQNDLQQNPRAHHTGWQRQSRVDQKETTVTKLRPS